MASDGVEQWAHRAMGLGAGLTGLYILLRRREWVSQWPPGWPVTLGPRRSPDGIERPSQRYTQLARVRDTGHNERSYAQGYTVAYAVAALGWFALGYWEAS